MNLPKVANNSVACSCWIDARIKKKFGVKPIWNFLWSVFNNGNCISAWSNHEMINGHFIFGLFPFPISGGNRLSLKLTVLIFLKSEIDWSLNFWAEVEMPSERNAFSRRWVQSRGLFYWWWSRKRIMDVCKRPLKKIVLKTEEKCSKIDPKMR